MFLQNEFAWTLLVMLCSLWRILLRNVSFIPLECVGCVSTALSSAIVVKSDFKKRNYYLLSDHRLLLVCSLIKSSPHKRKKLCRLSPSVLLTYSYRRKEMHFILCIFRNHKQKIFFHIFKHVKCFSFTLYVCNIFQVFSCNIYVAIFIKKTQLLVLYLWRKGVLGTFYLLNFNLMNNSTR